jgi:hypothetical protein
MARVHSNSIGGGPGAIGRGPSIPEKETGNGLEEIQGMLARVSSPRPPGRLPASEPVADSTSPCRP